MKYFVQGMFSMVAGGLSPRVQHAGQALLTGSVWGAERQQKGSKRRTCVNRLIQGGIGASFKSCRGHHKQLHFSADFLRSSPGKSRRRRIRFEV